MKKTLQDYRNHLKENELAENTIKKYIRDAQGLLDYVGEDLSKQKIIDYKQELKNRFKPNTVNNKIITINKYLKFLGEGEKSLKPIKVQATGLDGTLKESEYQRIYRQAEQKGTSRDRIVLEVFYNTGLRVSELEFLTVEALTKKSIAIDTKGKIRKVPIPKTLEKSLKAYISQENIKKGPILLSNRGEPISRSTVFTRIKYLAGQARIKKDKAYPHAIRHLFAKNWLERNNNILQLADILGHSSLETTRIYTKLDTDELRKTMEN